MKSAALVCVYLTTAVAGSTLSLPSPFALGARRTRDITGTRAEAMARSSDVTLREFATDQSEPLEALQTLDDRTLSSRQLQASFRPDISTSADDAVREGRFFIPRRKLVKTCLAVTTATADGDAGGDTDGDGLNLDELLDTINSNKAMLAAGQTSILTAIAGISTGGTCDISSLTTGQTNILNAIAALGTDLDQLDDILAAIETAKSMILDGQTTINTNIADLDNDLEAVKAMLLAGQADINTNIDDVSTELAAAKAMLTAGQTTITDAIAALSTDLATAKTMIMDAIADLDGDIADISTQIADAKTMIIDGQTAITGDIADLSTQITNVETSIQSELTDIDTQLNTLEAGQQEICDKIEALDAKLDEILAKLMDGMTDTCADGSTPVGGECFSITTDKESMDDAAAVCATSGGTLATMTAENAAAIYALIFPTASKKAWIGLSGVGSTWRWDDGAAYGAYQDWLGGTEPTASDGDCVEATATSDSTGNWDVQPCTSNRIFICSTPP